MNLQPLADEVRRDAEALRLARGGMTRRDIAAKLHMGHSRIAELLSDVPRKVAKPVRAISAHYRLRPYLIVDKVYVSPDVIKAALAHGIGVKATARHIGIPEGQLAAWIADDKAWCEANGLCPRCEVQTMGEACNCVHDAAVADFITDEIAMAILGAALLRAQAENSAALSFAEDSRRT